MKRGFTFIEILIVLGIVALLAAVVYPSFKNARSAATQPAANVPSVTDLGDGMRIVDGEMFIPDTDLFPSRFAKYCSDHPESVWMPVYTQNSGSGYRMGYRIVAIRQPTTKP